MRKILFICFILFISFSAIAQQEKGKINKWNNSFEATQKNQPELKVYPNPCKEQKITVELNDQELSEIKITNITGKQYYYKKLAIPEAKEQILLENFPNGLYIIQIKTTDNKLVAKKLLIATS